MMVKTKINIQIFGENKTSRVKIRSHQFFFSFFVSSGSTPIALPGILLSPIMNDRALLVGQLELGGILLVIGKKKSELKGQAEW
jgi:hypothetical protein